MYFKVIFNNCILGVGIGNGGVQISQSEYEEITSIFRNRPVPTEGKGYRLKTDLTWEEYDLPEPSEDEEIDDSEALSILTGESE